MHYGYAYLIKSNITVSAFYKIKPHGFPLISHNNRQHFTYPIQQVVALKVLSGLKSG